MVEFDPIEFQIIPDGFLILIFTADPTPKKAIPSLCPLLRYGPHLALAHLIQLLSGAFQEFSQLFPCNIQLQQVIVCPLADAVFYIIQITVSA